MTTKQTEKVGDINLDKTRKRPEKIFLGERELWGKRFPVSPRFEQTLLQLQRMLFNGHDDKSALLEAIRFCLRQRIVAPEWVVSAFFRAITKWDQYEVKELGEAFGIKRRKGQHLRAANKRYRLMQAVYILVREARNEGRAVDDELFEVIGKNLGLGRTLVKKYYRAARATSDPAASELMGSLLEESGQRLGFGDAPAKEFRKLSTATRLREDKLRLKNQLVGFDKALAWVLENLRREK